MDGGRGRVPVVYVLILHRRAVLLVVQIPLEIYKIHDMGDQERPPVIRFYYTLQAPRYSRPSLRPLILYKIYRGSYDIP